MIPVATKEMVSGTKNTALKKRSKRTPSTNTATSRPPITGNTRVKATQSTVLRMEIRKSRSASRRV